MLNIIRNKSKWGARLLGVLATFIVAGSGSALAATFDLYAKAGSTTLPGGATVPVWGYLMTDSAPTIPGGPTLIVNQGETVQVTLHNGLTETTGVLFQGQSIVPDMTGVAAGGTKSYTFVATKPGTFLYEAALLPNAQYQAAMGLYGALIVRPARTDSATTVVSNSFIVTDAAISATDVLSSVSGSGIPSGTTITAVTPGVSFTMSAAAIAAGDGTVVVTKTNAAYSNTATAFNDEAVLVLSEIDPALNASPAAFDMRNYAPKYFLINGKPYPNTDPITSAAGNKVLLRYVNAGVQHHSMAVLGLRQVFIAKDGSTLPTLNHDVVAETLAPGQTGDAIATIPAEATTESKFTVYDGSLSLHNNGLDSAFGGMLTFITAGTGSPTTGPTTSSVTVAPSPTNGSVPVALAASINSASSTVTAAEYFIDATGTAGTGTPMSGTFGSTTALVNATLSPAQLALLASGNHTIYVHGKDATNKWGAFSSAALNLDKTGPATTGLTLTPNPSNGTVNVVLSGTVDDSATGGSNIVAAEYFIGTAPPVTTRGTSMDINLAAPVASLSKTIVCTTGNPCAGGAVINVRSQDALGNWGAFATVTLNTVAGGPVTSNVSASPSANNGSYGVNSSSPAVRVSATLTSAITTTSVAAEGFIDAVTAVGTGFPFIPSDGAWNSVGALNSAVETVYADIPLATINALSTGMHTISVRGKDALGNWGSVVTINFLIDRTAPVFTGISVAPTAINAAGGNTVALTVNGASDPLVAGYASGVAGGEYWIDTAAPAPGGGTAFSGQAPSISIAALTDGTHTIGARIRDAAGNWSATTASATIQIDRTPPTVLSINRVGAAATTNAASVQFLVTFSESVAVGSSANFGLTTTGTLSASSIVSVTGSGTTRTVTVNTGTGDGTLRLDMTSTAGVADPAGNPVTVPFTTGQVFTIDRTRPTVSITRVGSQFTNAGSVQFSVTFSESVTGVAANDFQLSENLSGTTTPSLAGSGSAYTVTVTTGSGNGTLGLNMPNGATVSDLAGNTLIVPVTGPVFTIDRTAPTISNATLTPSTLVFGTASVALSVTASDIGGAGLAGGQYWIDGTATPPANPTAFTGLSATLDTNSLAGGSHTVYVRVQDAAGNWSTVTNRALTVVLAVVDAKSFAATGVNGIQTQSYNTNNTSLRANDFPTAGTTTLVSAPVRIGGTGTVVPTLSCPAGGGNTAATPSVDGSTICTNGRFNVNLPDPGGNNAAQIAGRQGTYTFTYTITANGVTSAPVTVTITVN